MISREAQKFKEILKGNYVSMVDYENMDVQAQRAMFESVNTLEALPIPKGVTCQEEKINGIIVEKITVTEMTDKIILHMHGGGMVLGDHRTGRFMLSHVANLTKRTAYSVNYRLCPEYSQPAAIEDCVSVYQGLLSIGHQGKDIVLLGESAGGALVMSLCAYLKKYGIDMPGAVCSISGSVDSQYNSVSMTKNIPTEIVVNINLPEVMQAIYFKNCDPMDPVLSPINSDVTGWPPVYLHVCKDEILLDESIRMYNKLKDAGVETELTIKEDLFHTYMMYNLPESYIAFDEIAAFFSKY